MRGIWRGAIAVRLNAGSPTRPCHGCGIAKRIKFELGFGLFCGRTRRFRAVVLVSRILCTNSRLDGPTSTSGRWRLIATGDYWLFIVGIGHLRVEERRSRVGASSMGAVAGD